MDVLGQVSTLTTHEAALGVAKSKDSLFERYLWALSQSSNPDIQVAQGKQFLCISIQKFHRQHAPTE
jgi:hypothetical protein